VVDLPRVTVWQDGGTVWNVVGELPAYTSLSFEARYNDTGPWTMTVPWNTDAQKVATEHVLTFDWRGARPMTGVIGTYERAVDDDGNPVLNLSGLDALAYVGYCLAWPQPANPIGSQVIWDPNAAPPIRTTAGAAVRKLVLDNVVTRRTLNLTVAIDQGLGSTVSVRPAFDNLLELVLRKANRGGVGVRVNMNAAGSEGIDSTLGSLTFRTYAGTDRSIQVQFSDVDGSIASWTRTRNAPTASNVVVSGVQGKYRRVGRNAAGWNPTREQFVQGPASYDDTELDQAADEALDQGEPQVNVQVVAAETPSQLAFTHFDVGDTATAVLGAQTLTDVISAIKVTVDENGPKVTPVFGDPDGIDPRDKHAQLLRRARRDLDHQKRRTTANPNTTNPT
jgi:hypothetical protein